MGALKTDAKEGVFKTAGNLPCDAGSVKRGESKIDLEKREKGQR
jgi:hypothetical protein